MQGHIKEADFSAYLDRQLDVRQTRAVDEHLQSCTSCKSTFDEMRDLTRLFRESERAEPSPFLWNRIEASLDEQPKPRKAAALAGLRLFGWRPVLATASLGFLLIVGITVYIESARNTRQESALAEIDKTYQSLASKNPDTYNPFSTGSGAQWDSNPFRSLRLSGRAGTPPKLRESSGDQ